MKFLACIVLATFAVCPLVRPEAQQRNFSVKDDIEMVRFSDPFPFHQVRASTIAKESPDGMHFAVVTTRGLLDSDLVESSVTIFDRNDLRNFVHGSEDAEQPKPRVIARLRSYPHREQSSAFAPVIKDLRWAPDQRHVYFRGESLEGNYQIYEASISVTSMQVLTPADQSVDHFDFVRGRIVYRASSPAIDPYDSREWANRDTELVTGHTLEDVLFTGQMTTIIPERFKMEVLTLRGDHWVRRSLPGYSEREFPYLAYLFPFSTSPHGDMVVTMTPVAKIPESWSQYKPAPGFEMWRFGVDDAHRTDVRSSTRPQQYSLVDLATGATRPLLQAPNARTLAYSGNNRAVWSRDGKRILLTNTFLEPPEYGDESSLNRMPCAVVSVDVTKSSRSCLVFVDREFLEKKLQVAEVMFGRDEDHVMLLLQDPAGHYEVRSYAWNNEVWQPRNSSPFDGLPADFLRHGASFPVAGDQLTVAVRQSLNIPPTLWVSDDATGRAKKLWDPNPQLEQLRFGQASVYHWKDKAGSDWTGALVKPVGYVQGKRYPAVIQMYSFEDGLFLTDGTDPTAFAARHLASGGFVVLQIQKKTTTVSAADTETSLRGYESAVASLSDAGLIDSQKVGVAGFSWTCWYAEDAIVKDPTLFAAATIADGLTNSYMEYELVGDGNHAVRLQMEKIRGGTPYGAGLKGWVDTAPGFHMDQVKAPVRFEATNALSVLGEWELYASLRMQNKPVDFIYFPHGTHIHQRPLERLESQQGSVDWFRFWLQGYEDPDPSKADQYRRWRGMRESGNGSETIP